MIYQRGDRRVRRVLRLFQPLLGFSGASAFSVCSAVKFKDIAISLEKSTVDFSKAVRDLKHDPKVTPEDGIRRTVEWMKSIYHKEV